MKKQSLFKQGTFLIVATPQARFGKDNELLDYVVKSHIIIISTCLPCVVDYQNSHNTAKLFPPVADGIHFLKLGFCLACDLL